MPTVVKFKTAKRNLKARLAEDIAAWVLETLEESPVSDSSFLGTLRVKRADFIRSFRKKMVDRRLWEPLKEALAKERIDQMIVREFNKQQRHVSDAAQFTLPGFEHLPRRINTGHGTLPLQQVTVSQLIVFVDAYEDRTRKSVQVCEELVRLRDLVREQPAELSVPEAVARANAGITTHPSREVRLSSKPAAS